MNPWVRVLGFCRTVGVEMKIGPIPGGYMSPFSEYLGLDWDRRILFVRNDGLERPRVVGEMIHEIGHLVACADPPYESSEGTFVAWEWRAALLCGVRKEWRLSMDNYVTDTQDAFGDLPLRDQLAYLRRQMVVGRRIGNVSPSGRPVSLR